MDRIDWASQPSWLIALMVLISGLVVPIATAIIGKWRSKADEPPPPPPPQQLPVQPIEVTTPWLVQNLLEIKLNVETIKHDIAALTDIVNRLAALIEMRRR